MAVIFTKIYKDGTAIIRISDCNRTIKLWNDMNEPEQVEEMLTKITTIQKALDEFKKEVNIKKVREILSNFPGIKVMDKPEESYYPTPLFATEKDEVFVGRIRKNPAIENAIDMWVVSDNIRKGAALNTIQIAEKMIEMSLL